MWKLPEIMDFHLLALQNVLKEMIIKNAWTPLCKKKRKENNYCQKHKVSHKSPAWNVSFS
jgi:hypothetical protein